MRSAHGNRHSYRQGQIDKRHIPVSAGVAHRAEEGGVNLECLSGANKEPGQPFAARILAEVAGQKRENSRPVGDS